MINMIPKKNDRYKINKPVILQSPNYFKITNLAYIASQIGHPVECIYKYLSLTMGCSYNLKNGIKYNGPIDINRKIQNYCVEFCLCMECNIPEIRPKIYCNECILTCSSCGQDYTVVHTKNNIKILKLMKKILKSQMKKEVIIGKSNIVSFD